MKNYSIIVLLWVIFSGIMVFAQKQRPVIPESSKSIKNPFAYTQENIRIGYNLYKKSCYQCHGEKGYGDGPQVNQLKTKPANITDADLLKLTDGELFWWTFNGGNDMQPFKEVLTNEQIWKTIIYLRKLQSN